MKLGTRSVDCAHLLLYFFVCRYPIYPWCWLLQIWIKSENYISFPLVLIHICGSSIPGVNGYLQVKKCSKSGAQSTDLVPIIILHQNFWSNSKNLKSYVIFAKSQKCIIFHFFFTFRQVDLGFGDPVQANPLTVPVSRRSWHLWASVERFFHASWLLTNSFW